MSYDKQPKSHSGSGGSGGGHFGPSHEKKRDMANEAAERSMQESGES